jgi:polysaccharide pyruvyl transferase WcaK-like protein
MRIVLTNVYDDNNRGSCALTWAALELLELAFPGCDVTILPVAARDRDAFRHTARRFPRVVIADPPFDGANKSDFARIVLLLGTVARILLARRRRTNDANHWMKCLQGVDLVVARGGVSIHTVEESFRGDARHLVRLLPLLAARMLRTPFVLLGAQIGPFRTGFGRILFGFLLASARGLIARDEIAVSEVVRRNLGETPVLLMPDTAFALASDDIAVAPSAVCVAGELTGQTLALVISSALRPHESADAHAALFALAATSVRATGTITSIRIVVQANADREISRRLCELLGLSQSDVLDVDWDPQQLSAMYSACDMMIASRLHAAVLSLGAGTPAVLVAPEVTFKERAVLKVLGLEDLCVPSSAGAAAVSDLCVQVATALPYYRLRVRAAAADARDNLQNSVPTFLRNVASGTPALSSSAWRTTRCCPENE